MKMTGAIILLGFAMLAPLTAEGERARFLEPAEDLLFASEWEQPFGSAVREVLLEDVVGEPLIYYLRVPWGRGSERAVAVARDEDRYLLSAHAAGGAPLRAAEDPATVSVTVHRVEIDRETAQQMQEVFSLATRLARYPAFGSVRGPDGVTHYFSVRRGTRRTGKVWSPPTDSPTGRRVAYAALMTKFTRVAPDRREEVRQRLELLGSNLLGELRGMQREAFRGGGKIQPTPGDGSKAAVDADAEVAGKASGKFEFADALTLRVSLHPTLPAEEEAAGGLRALLLYVGPTRVEPDIQWADGSPASAAKQVSEETMAGLIGMLQEGGYLASAEYFFSERVAEPVEPPPVERHIRTDFAEPFPGPLAEVRLTETQREYYLYRIGRFEWGKELLRLLADLRAASPDSEFNELLDELSKTAGGALGDLVPN